MLSIDQASAAISDALSSKPAAAAARWRWGTVVSVSSSGTMNVSIGGSTVPGIRCAQHVAGAQVGDRVRVMYQGTDAIVDAVRATSKLMSLPPISGDLNVSGGITANDFNGFRGRILLATTTDIDNLFATGFYYIQAGGVGGTLPSGVTGAYGSLICTGSTTEDAGTWAGKQILITGTTLYVRSYSGTPRSWGAWGEHRALSSPSQTTTVASIASAESNVTISAATYSELNGMGQVLVTLSRSTAISANTDTTLCTMVSGKRPAQQVNGSFSTAGGQNGTVRMLANGGIRVRSTAQIAANTSFTLIFPAYLLA